MIKNIRHFGIPIKNIKSSLEFYVNLLGFKIVLRKTIQGGYAAKLLNKKGLKVTYIKLQYQNNPIFLELLFQHYPKYRFQPAAHHIAFSVDDIDLTYLTMKFYKTKFLSQPLVAPDSGCAVCFCMDPSGNMIELVEVPK